jgi:hypothetical protein
MDSSPLTLNPPETRDRNFFTQSNIPCLHRSHHWAKCSTSVASQRAACNLSALPRRRSPCPSPRRNRYVLANTNTSRPEAAGMFRKGQFRAGSVKKRSYTRFVRINFTWKVCSLDSHRLSKHRFAKGITRVTVSRTEQYAPSAACITCCANLRIMFVFIEALLWKESHHDVRRFRFI